MQICAPLLNHMLLRICLTRNGKVRNIMVSWLYAEPQSMMLSDLASLSLKVCQLGSQPASQPVLHLL